MYIVIVLFLQTDVGCAKLQDAKDSRQKCEQRRDDGDGERPVESLLVNSVEDERRQHHSN